MDSVRYVIFFLVIYSNERTRLHVYAGWNVGENGVSLCLLFHPRNTEVIMIRDVPQSTEKVTVVFFVRSRWAGVILLSKFSSA